MEHISSFQKSNKISTLLDGQFHIVVVQKRQVERKVQKSVMHVQRCCFAYNTYNRNFDFLVVFASLDLTWRVAYRIGVHTVTDSFS